MKILVLNCGSSTVKYQFFDMTTGEGIVLAHGKVEKIGSDESLLEYNPNNAKPVKVIQKIPSHHEAIEMAIRVLTNEEYGVIKNKTEISAIGHRVVHGGDKFTQPMIVNEEVKKGIKDCFDFAPLHNPHHLEGILACEKFMEGVLQVAVFDTAFHQTMQEHAYLYALPYHLYKKYGIRRYGFHGISHQYISVRASKLLDKPLNEIKLVTCHLGNGCSVCAIDGGKSVDTSMGLTPLEGLVMGTRCGDLDPTIVVKLMVDEGLSQTQVLSLLNSSSGLYGISGLGNDMRTLTAESEKGNLRAKLAIEIFSYRLRKYIASYLGVLNGADAVIYTGGIGENNSLVREKSCGNMENLGIKLDREKNLQCIRKEGIISLPDSDIKVLVLPTNEELMIALAAKKIVGGQS